METIIRKPYEGVLNIIRFNWHFYVGASMLVAALFAGKRLLSNEFSTLLVVAAAGIIAFTFVSLLASYYIYDISPLYKFDWIKEVATDTPRTVVNIHAGFDETSSILTRRFSSATFHVFDFYDPVHHTEISIERARRAYPAFQGTKRITTTQVPLPLESVELIFNIFALHEIRDRDERINFIKAQCAVLRSEGRCIIVEHLRDIPNFAVYSIGFFHFFSRKEWTFNFSKAGLEIERQFRITPFITAFVLKKSNGTTA